MTTERMKVQTDDGHRVVVGATTWQRLILRTNNARVGPWRAMVYAVFAVAFGLCDVAEAIREQNAPSNINIRQRPDAG